MPQVGERTEAFTLKNTGRFDDKFSQTILLHASWDKLLLFLSTLLLSEHVTVMVIFRTVVSNHITDYTTSGLT